jgi:hypothetical protein
VREYDPQSGAGEALGYSPFSEENPKAAYAGGRIFIFENKFWNRAYVLDKNLCADGGDLIDLPEFNFGENNRRDEEVCVLAESDYSVVPCGNTLILTGPAARYSSSDTFMLRAGEKTFRPCSRRISDAEVFMPAAAELDGRLYVIGTSVIEPDKRVFRSTEVSGLKPIKEKVVKGRTCSCGGQLYTVTALPSKKSQGEVALKEAKDVKDVTVPAAVRLPDCKTYKVTSVRKSAFRGHAARTVTIGKNVRKISKNAFANCNGITEIIIPDSVTYIATQAFYRCNGLTRLVIGKGVTYIGDGAFNECEKLSYAEFTVKDGWYTTHLYEEPSPLPFDTNDPSISAGHISGNLSKHNWNDWFRK